MSVGAVGYSGYAAVTGGNPAANGVNSGGQQSSSSGNDGISQSGQGHHSGTYYLDGMPDAEKARRRKHRNIVFAAVAFIGVTLGAILLIATRGRFWHKPKIANADAKKRQAAAQQGERRAPSEGARQKKRSFGDAELLESMLSGSVAAAPEGSLARHAASATHADAPDLRMFRRLRR